MANQLKITTQGYGKIERNETELTISRLHDLAEIFGVSIKDILLFDDTDNFIKKQTNKDVEKVIVCHTYYEKERIDSEIELLVERINHLENEVKQIKK